MMPASWGGSKQALKDELQSRPDGERLWQTLQGRVYGSAMAQAVMFPGVALFLMRSRHRDNDLFIVSHKTEFGHFDSTRTPLRQTALSWMESNGFFEKNRFGLSKENVFFKGTRQEKILQIANLNLDVFIDDLEEVFAEEGFPPIKKVLFNAKAKGRYHDVHCNNWTEIGQQIFGSMSDAERKFVAQTLCREQIESVTQLPGHGNSRVYRVLTDCGTVYVLKLYPDLVIDPRPRLRREVRACNILEHLGFTPRSVAHDEELNVALFEWIDGETPRAIEISHIDQALSFAKKLKDLPRSKENNMPEASEACLSGVQLLSQVKERIQILDTINSEELQQFLKTTIKPLWEELQEWSAVNWPVSSFENELAQSKQTLSPSDFGFHNALEKRDKSLRFVDLEYFGRDDPVKLIADFLWHPAMNLELACKKRWLQGMFAIFYEDSELSQRFRAAWPIYGLRWALIMLNEFRPDGWQKRLYAAQMLQKIRKHIQYQQLQKAAGVCRFIRDEKLECPYV
jgi:hypothetical protein